jgi:hypothetical protein
VQADRAAFIDRLYATEEALKQRLPVEGGQEELVSALDKQFEQIGNSEPDDAWKLGDHNVVGAQAAFLKDLKHRADDYKKHIPTKAELVATFLQEWVTFHHKKRKRSPMRSPFESSTYLDGYISLNTTLHYDAAYSGWFIAHGSFASAALHCPNSVDVAHALQQTIQPFNLDELDVPIVIELRASDSAHEQLPTKWKSQRVHRMNVLNGIVMSGAKEFWYWVMRETGTSTRDVLRGVNTLQG